MMNLGSSIDGLIQSRTKKKIFVAHDKVNHLASVVIPIDLIVNEIQETKEVVLSECVVYIV